MQKRKYPGGTSDLNKIVKDASVDGLGKGVPRELRLLLVELHVNGLRLATPLAVHFASRQLCTQHLHVNAKQVGRKLQDWWTQGACLT